jgi:hypothetical protein
MQYENVYVYAAPLPVSNERPKMSTGPWREKEMGNMVMRNSWFIIIANALVPF